MRRTHTIAERRNCFLSLPVIFITASCFAVMYGCCGTRSRTATRSHMRDSVVTVRQVEYMERVRDTTIYVRLPAERLETIVRVDSSFLETSLAFSKAGISGDGSLYHTLENKPGPVEVEVPLKERERVVSAVEQINSRTVVEVPVKAPMSVRENFLLYSGVLLWGVLAGAVIFFLIRIFKRAA